MSFSQMQTGAGNQQQFVQKQLQNLLQTLNWSYVALWSFNSHTRSLEWTEGHFRVSSSAVSRRGDTEVWNEHFFNSTYKSCIFSRGQGSVGRAFANGRNIWLNGPLVPKSAGSEEQAQFLQLARIETATCIPWTDGVLELGTCETVAENNELMVKIHQHFTKNILPSLGQQQPASHSVPATMVTGVSPPPNAPQPPSRAPRSMMQAATFPSVSPLRHQSETLVQTFEPNSLNQQIIRRSASLSNLNTDMFLQHPEDATEGSRDVGTELDTDMLLADPRWRVPTPTRPAPENNNNNIRSSPLSAANAALMSARGQYRSHSGTTSSSVSSREDGSNRQLSVDSPEQNMFFKASSVRQSSHSNTSSSPRRGTSSHSPEVQALDDPTKASGPATSLQDLRVDDDYQTAMTIMLAEGDSALDPQEQWRNLYNSPLDQTSTMSLGLDSSTFAPEVAPPEQAHNMHSPSPGPGSAAQNQTHGPFKSWRHTRILAPIMQKNDRTNQLLLRRCIDLMKQIPNLQQGVQTEGAVVQKVGQQGPRVASSSSPETVPDIGIAHDPFDQVGPSRMQRRPRGGSRIATMAGPVHAGHDEAAMNHMMAERRRRVKQKENFTALRRLVPIISKADKASILGDAIVYLKDLQKQIEELEASKAETERRYESLKTSFQHLEQRNKELESMASTSGVSHLMRPTRLHSMQSF